MTTNPRELARNADASRLPTESSDQVVGLELYQGPLPDAQELAAYERAFPGAADRILKMAERDQKAIIHLRLADWLTSFVVALFGQMFLYVLVLAAVYLAINDKPLEAFLAGLAPIVVTIYANTRKRKAEPDAPEG